MSGPTAPPALLTVGRINLDLYSQQVGAPMDEAITFRGSVGGSPTNVAIAACRLGTPAAVLTAAGQDHAGDLVLAQLVAAGVDTRWVYRLASGATSMALLATLAPDEGQRQFYRDNPADIHLDPSVVDLLPWDTLQLVLVSADALARGTTTLTVEAVAAEAASRNVPIWWDLDLRETTWPDLQTYAATVRPALRDASVVLGTEAEYAALLGSDDTETLHHAVAELERPCAVVKTGSRGAMLYRRSESPVLVPAATTQPVCTVGGGDALAGGLIHARLAEKPWPEALRFGMQAAGWTVNQPGCSQGFPTAEQLNNLVIRQAS